MALEMRHRDPTGVDHPAAYWRIDELDLDYRAHRAQIRVACFHDVSAARSGYAAVDQVWYYPDSDAFDRLFVPGAVLAGVKDARGVKLDFADPRAAAYHYVKAEIETTTTVPSDLGPDGAVLTTRDVTTEAPGRFGAARDA